MAQGVSLEAIRSAAGASGRAELAVGDAAPAEEHIPFEGDAKKLLQLTAREALRLGHNYIGTEHILLAVLRDKDTQGARLLIDNGVDRKRTEAWIVARLDEQRRRSG